MDTRLVPIISAPHFDPDMGRRELKLPYGLTIAAIMAIALPGIREEDWHHFRVVLVTPAGSQIVDRRYWHVAKPHAGVSVVIRPVPGGNFFKQILGVVVSLAAVALGQLWGPALAFSLNGAISAGLASSLITVGLSVLGNLALNALIPPPSNKIKDTDKTNNYTITGWKNQARLNEPVPMLYGKMRYAPPFAALPYTEIVNDLQYIRVIFCFGYGPISISDLKIGDTSIDEYDDIEIELREGRATDLPLTLYTKQVIEEQVGAELQRPKPRDDAGNVISGPSIETPLTRTTARNVTEASIIIGFPSGLCNVKDDGSKSNQTVSIRIRQRQLPDGVFEDVTTLNITAKKLEAFFRQYTWELPARGVYEIEVTRMTDEDTSTRVQSRSLWSVLQSSRPEYPINFAKPLALAAIRIKASYQLNGVLDNFNALVSKLCLDYDVASETWIERETSNVASAYRLSMQGNHTAKPVSDAGIDLDALEELHEFCVTKGLKFDAVIDSSAKAGEVWANITHAGRSMHRHNGIKWGVITDNPAELPIVDQLSHKDTFQFSFKRQYLDPPHAFRVEFQDATNDYKTAERIIPWPGHVGDITVTEVLDLPGKTDPDEIWTEARRRQYELIYRPDVYNLTRDTPVSAATRGSRIAASLPILKSQQVAGRVVAAADQLVALDEEVTMEDGKSYAIRFQKITEEDTVGVSVVRQVRTIPGTSKLLSLSDSGDLPDEGQMVHFGIAGEQSFDLVVTRIEAGDKMASVLQLADLAPEIDELLAADIPPLWSGIVGSEIDDTAFVPQPPVFDTIVSGITGTGVEGRINVTLHAASTGAAVATFDIEHRIAGAWEVETIAAADGSIDIDGYATGDVVEIRAKAWTVYDVPSAYNTTVAIVVGNDDADVPTALPAGVTAIALLGGATVNFATNDNAATVKVNIYRNTTGVLNKETDLAKSIDTTPSQTYSTTLGDATRTNRYTTADFSVAGSWLLGTGWSIASGVATHAAGSASDLTQSDTSLSSGQYYRFGFTLSGVTAGSLNPVLKGTTTVNGTLRTANGTFTGRLQAVTGNNETGFHASSDFAGSIDNVTIYRESATCLPQGTNYIWLAPANADGLEGPVSGPYTVSII